MVKKRKRNNQTLLLVVIVIGLFVLLMNNPDFSGEAIKKLKSPLNRQPSSFSFKGVNLDDEPPWYQGCVPACRQKCPSGYKALQSCFHKSSIKNCAPSKIACYKEILDGGSRRLDYGDKQYGSCVFGCSGHVP